MKGTGNWSQVARRIRVPLGFAFAGLYFWLARPTAHSLAGGGCVAVAGLILRAAASGHVRKNTELATSGPYAYTRNPLYLGSAIIALGFAGAARSGWIFLVLAAIFFAVYLPVIRAEEEFLERQFPEYRAYAERVPRLGIKLARGAKGKSRFSLRLYWQHREYNAVLGAVLMMAALVAKMYWWKG
jgi:protein-S-isoprenylcysteine O-methyltransferase Ste14